MSRRKAAAFAVLLALLLAAGCASKSEEPKPVPIPAAASAAPADTVPPTPEPTPAPTPEPTPSLYDAYREIVTQREWKYGEAGMEQVAPDMDYGYMKGVAMIRLLDWDGDGTEELLLWENTLNNGFPGAAQVEIWTWQDGKAFLAYSGYGLVGGDPGSQSFTTTILQGVRYLIVGQMADTDDVEFYAMSGTQLMAAHSLKSVWENPSKAVFDGREMDAGLARDTYLADRQILCNATESLADAEAILQQTRQTRAILGM